MTTDAALLAAVADMDAALSPAPPIDTAALAALATPRRRVWMIRGHARRLIPLGDAKPRQPVPGGWRVECECGWSNTEACATKRQAEETYRHHVDEVPERDWPECKRCGLPTRPSRMSLGSPHLCKGCRTAATQEWAQANPSQWERSRRKSYLKQKYGLTPEEADALLEAQGGKCAICGAEEGDSRGFRMHVDHKHGTNLVRGVLCVLCNNGLGNFRDNPDFLMAAAAYLAKSEARLLEQIGAAR